MPQQDSARIVKSVRSADGTKIYADAVGDSTDPALIFTHGFSGSAAAFDRIFSNPKNSKEFFLVRYDSRGHGRSGKPNSSEGYSSQNFAEDFEAVRKAFDAKRPIFIGWSMGGKTLTDIAAHLPAGTLRGAVALAGSPYLDPKMQDIRSVAMDSITPGLFSVDDSTAQQLANLAAVRLLFLRDPDPKAEFFRETLRAVVDGADFLEDNPDVSWETRCAFIGTSMHMSRKVRMFVVARQQDNTKVLELLRSGFPLLIVHGTHDAYISGEKMIEIIRPNVANLTVKMIQGASHAPFVEKPDDVMDAILHFAKGLT